MSVDWTDKIERFLTDGTLDGFAIGDEIDDFRLKFVGADWMDRPPKWIQLARATPFECVFTRDHQSQPMKALRLTLYLWLIDQTEVQQWVIERAKKMGFVASERTVVRQELGRYEAHFEDPPDNQLYSISFCHNGGWRDPPVEERDALPVAQRAAMFVSDLREITQDGTLRGERLPMNRRECVRAMGWPGLSGVRDDLYVLWEYIEARFGDNLAMQNLSLNLRDDLRVSVSEAMAPWGDEGPRERVLSAAVREGFEAAARVAQEQSVGEVARARRVIVLPISPTKIQASLRFRPDGTLRCLLLEGW